MKLTTIAMSLFACSLLQAQGAKDVFEAFGNGDVETIVRVMDRDVEMCFDDKVEFMDKKQAAAALRKFFDRNPPASFKRLHNGNSRGANSKYAIGSLRSTNGKKFRVYIFAKQGPKKYRIQELRFDRA